MRALSHYLMLPWSGGLPDSQQDWPERAARLTLLFQRNLHDYTMLARHLSSQSSADYHNEASTSAFEQGNNNQLHYYMQISSSELIYLI